MASCCFCDEIEHGRNRNFAARYPEIESRILWTDGALFAMPCIGQLQPNHFMILPVEHHTTLREAGDSIGHLDQSVDNALSYLLPRLGMAHSRCLVFEHGARAPSDGGCGIYHAHLHVVPRAQIENLSLVLDLQFTAQGSSLREVFGQQDNRGSYALAGYWGESLGIASLPEPLPSQYMRRKLSAAFGSREWDWRKAGRETSMLAAIASMQCA